MSKSTKLAAKLKSFRPHALSTPPDTPVLSLDIPSPGLLSNSPSELTGEDVNLDPPDLPHRPISPWVDLGQRSSDPSHLLLSGQDRLTDAGRRRTQYTNFSPAQLTQILNLAGPIIRERGLETLGLFRPWRFSESPFQIGRLQLLLIDHLLPSPPSSIANQPTRIVSLDDVRDQMVFTLVHDLVHVLKWSIRHLSYQPLHFALSSSWYTTFSQLERDKAFPLNAYVSILLPLLPLSSQQLLSAVLDLIAAVAAHADQNAMSASYLCKLLGFWILGFGSESFVSYDQLYFEWDRAGRAFEHVFLAYLRSQTSKLPKRLKELISVYPSGFTRQGAFCPRFTTKSIRVLKVQIETGNLNEPHQKLDQSELSLHQGPPRVTSPTPSTTVKRGPSIRSRNKTRPHRSVSRSTVTPVSLPSPPLPPYRNTLEILKSASLAHPAPDLSSAHYPLWKSLLDCSKAEDRHQLLVTSSSAASKELSAVKDVIGLLDDETLRVISLTQLPVVPSPSDQALAGNRLSSFSLDVPLPPLGSAPPQTKPATSGAAHLLGTLHEDNKHPITSSLLAPSVAPSIASSPTSPTASWADFVASGFAPAATSAPVLSPPGSGVSHVPLDAVMAPRTSLSTIRSAPASALTPKRSRTGYHKHKPPVARSQRPVRSVSSERAGPAPVPQVLDQQPDRTVRSINVVFVDESFPDVWIDTVGEPMILSRWPSFFISSIALPIPKSTGENLSDQPVPFPPGSSMIHQAGGRDTAGMPSHLLVDEVMASRQGFDQSHQSCEEVQTARDLASVTPNDRQEMAFVQDLPGQDSESRQQGQLRSSNDDNDREASHAQSSSGPLPPSTSTAPAAAKSNKVILAFSTFGRNSKRRISSFFASHQPVSGAVTDDEDSRTVKKKKKNNKWLISLPIARETTGTGSATAVKVPAAVPAVTFVDQESGNRREEARHEAQKPAAENDEDSSQPQLDEVREATAAQRLEGEQSSVVVDGKPETGGSGIAPGGALADSDFAKEQPPELLMAAEQNMDQKEELSHGPMENAAQISSNLRDECAGDHVVREDEDERETRRPPPSDFPTINPVDVTEQPVGLEDPSLMQKQEQPQVIAGAMAVADLIQVEPDDAQRPQIMPTSDFREHFLDLGNRHSVVEGTDLHPGDMSEDLGQVLPSKCEDGKIYPEQAHGALGQVGETADREQEGAAVNVEAALGGSLDWLPVESVADDDVIGQKDAIILLNEAKTDKITDTVDCHLPSYEHSNVDSAKTKKEAEVEGQNFLPLHPSEEDVPDLGVEAKEENPQLGGALEVVSEGPVIMIEPVGSTREAIEHVVDGTATVEMDPHVSDAQAPVTMSVDIPAIAVTNDSKVSVGHAYTAVASGQDPTVDPSSLSLISFAKSSDGEGEISPQRTWRTLSSSSHAPKTSDPTSPVLPARSILSKASIKFKRFSRSRKGSTDSAVTIAPGTSVPVTSPLEPTAEENHLQPFKSQDVSLISVKGSDGSSEV